MRAADTVKIRHSNCIFFSLPLLGQSQTSMLGTTLILVHCMSIWVEFGYVAKLIEHGIHDRSSRIFSYSLQLEITVGDFVLT
jgi:hypothetical protein